MTCARPSCAKQATKLVGLPTGYSDRKQAGALRLAFCDEHAEAAREAFPGAKVHSLGSSSASG